MAKKRKKGKAASHNPTPAILAQFRQRLWGGKKFNPRNVFHDLHATRDFREIRAVAKYLESPNNPLHRFIFGTPFARSYQEVRFSPIFAFTDDLQRDLDWLSLSVARYAREISSFVKQTVLFQKAFLLGSYERTNAILESITSEFGPSLWVLEKSFLVAEYAYGLESNKKLLTQIVEAETDDAILRFMADYMSFRCESKLSDENYRTRVIRTLLSIPDNVHAFRNFCQFRLAHLSMDLVPVASHVIWYESALPVVDRYLTFIAILQSCAVANSEFYNIASRIIRRVGGLIHDSRIDALLHFFTPDRKQLWNSLATKILDILDNYTDGNYESSAKDSSEILSENPEIFELYYIYNRSLDQMGKSC